MKFINTCPEWIEINKTLRRFIQCCASLLNLNKYDSKRNEMEYKWKLLYIFKIHRYINRLLQIYSKFLVDNITFDELLSSLFWAVAKKFKLPRHQQSVPPKIFSFFKSRTKLWKPNWALFRTKKKKSNPWRIRLKGGSKIWFA